MLLRYDEIGMILFVRFFFLHTCNPGHYEKKNIENSTWNTLDIFCCNTSVFVFLPSLTYSSVFFFFFLDFFSFLLSASLSD